MIVLDFAQRSPEWHAARRGIPTASEFAKIVTPLGKLSSQADDYMARLIDELVRPDAERPSWGGNSHSERGVDLEPDALDWYEFVTEAPVQRVGLVLTDDRRAGCSPDGLVGDSGGVECKAPDGPTHVAYMLAQELPQAYKPQVHGSLIVTGREWWDLVSYCPGYTSVCVRTYPSAYTKDLAKALDAFCDKLAEAKAKIIGATTNG